MNNKLTAKDFPRICRFCLLQSNELEDISEIPSVNIFKILTEMEFESMLPEKICLSCIQIFKDFSAFIEKSKQNIDFLKAILEDSHLETDCDKFTCEEDNDSFNGSDEENNVNKETNEGRRRQKRLITESSKTRNKNGTFKRKVKKKFSLTCDTCKENFLVRKLLLEHYMKVPNCIPERLKSECNTCNKIFIGKQQLKSHYKQSQECKLQQKICLCQCGASFPTKTKLHLHYKENPHCQPNDYSCLQCNKAFNKKHKLINHMRSHTKEAPFECTECGKRFRFQQNLRRHLLIHEGVKPFKCDVCGKTFSRAHVKKEHMNIHTGHNPYICTYCGKGFKRYANHFIHVYRHKLINGEVYNTEDTKLYLQLKCNICNRIFASRGGLANHLALHQEEPREKKFLCYKCGKGFVTKAQLESHSRTHTGDRPYECSQCSKRFKQKSAYSNHLLVHSGEKPFQCKLCEKLFTQSGHLKVHMRMHSGEKPFVCSFCGKKFALKSNLKVHTRIHTGETPYVCSVCNHGYYDSTSLKKHMKKHGVGIPNHGHITSKEDITTTTEKAIIDNNLDLLHQANE